MIVLCTGIMRSGSTWSYNVALNIARIATDVVHCGYVGKDKLSESIADVPEGAIGVFKCHTPDSKVINKIREGEYKNIITVRHPLDCIASRQKFADEPLFKSVHWLQQNIWCVHQMMGGVRPLLIKYEEMMKVPIETILWVAAYMGYQFDNTVLKEIHAATSMEATKKFCDTIQRGDGVLEEGGHLIDIATALHRNHIGDGKVGKWVEELGVHGDTIKNHLSNEIKFLGY